MNAAFIAVDSGGTRSHVKLTLQGDDVNDIQLFEVPSTISGILPGSQYGQVLRDMLRPVEKYWIEHDPQDTDTYLFIGAAGYANSTRELFQDVLFDVLPTMLAGTIVTAGAVNDAVGLLLGYESDGAIIVGTGSNILVRSSDAKIYQVGGQDWVADDNGAGFWIGLRAIRKVSRAHAMGEQSVLLSRFEETYGITPDKERELFARFRSLAVADRNMKAGIARFAASVCAAAESGDAEAQDIVKLEAEDLADSAAIAIRRRFSKTEVSGGLRFVQCGNVLKNEFFRASFEAQLNMRLRSGDGEAANIEWLSVRDGIEGYDLLAKRLTGPVDDLLRIDLMYRPVILHFK
ncbi:MAG: hypothetical protein LBI64_05480 [Coriobacteriales bacterium]|jgi:N-acetylglucosamine kinase-like BadF-type ATPase|nr:hypothetical protein [Coriobacteriales bacterium]